MVRYGFRVLNLNRIELTVYAGNEPAIRAYRRAGFVQEGRARQVFYRNGVYEDALRFGILRSEWEDDLEDSTEQAEHDEDELPVCDPALVTK
jgi:RimJ/RimL family protein N-acetyltransferase